MQRLELPTVLEKLSREPIEKFRMAGRFAKCSKVVGRRDDALTEVPLAAFFALEKSSDG